jgi:hypothetical protein
MQMELIGKWSHAAGMAAAVVGLGTELPALVVVFELASSNTVSSDQWGSIRQ